LLNNSIKFIVNSGKPSLFVSKALFVFGNTVTATGTGAVQNKKKCIRGENEYE